MQNSIYSFNKMSNLWSLEVNIAILEQVKVTEQDDYNQFFMTQRLRGGQN